MKLSKISLLVIASASLTACSFYYNVTSSGTHYESYYHFETRDPISSKEPTITSETQISSSSTTSSSTVTTSSVTPVEDKELIISFYNPTCGSISTEVIDEKLKTYINDVAETTFVESIKNSKCQISNDIPNKGEKVLIIGSASSAGSLEFTFTEVVKAITITAQTYHKPYVDYATGDTIANVDTNSVLYVNNKNAVDLKTENNQPVEKDYSEAINGKTLKLSTNDEEKSRAFIKSIKFIY